MALFDTICQVESEDRCENGLYGQLGYVGRFVQTRLSKGNSVYFCCSDQLIVETTDKVNSTTAIVGLSQRNRGPAPTWTTDPFRVVINGIWKMRQTISKVSSTK
ncbi:unnamed protein product [Protopolystoma xenopodis]|uniref:Uncharacterized protein n=1 Tax=Protopolystoma xenopodis TaxID=117903 RepID=A0A448WB73_9PLAT|nr:unnamed protein product [Protopolystoma xenopodis]